MNINELQEDLINAIKNGEGVLFVSMDKNTSLVKWRFFGLNRLEIVGLIEKIKPEILGLTNDEGADKIINFYSNEGKK